jgi:DNA-binding response OmpR family regulator
VPEQLILVVEDEPTLAEAVAARLRAERFAVQVAADGPAAVESFRRHRPELVVLDLMLPGFDGLEVCRRIQAERPVPVLMLTARDGETDQLVGLGVGADDYLTKPFSMRVLVARVRALLRRAERAAAPPADVVRAGPIEVDVAARRVRCRDAEVHAPPDLVVLADRDRLHQVVANLVDNGGGARPGRWHRHGHGPPQVRGAGAGGRR